MSKWAGRMAALPILLAFALIMTHLHRQLITLQRQQQRTATR